MKPKHNWYAEGKRQDNGINTVVKIRHPKNDGTYYGYLERWDEAEGGNEYYCEGGLWFNFAKELTDYDGVYQLSNPVIELIESFGFNADYAKD